MKILFVFFVLFLANTNVYGGLSSNNYEITVDVANVRTEANANSEIIERLEYKQIVQVLESFDNGWSFVTFTSSIGERRRGYMRTQFIKSSVPFENGERKHFGLDTEITQEFIDNFLAGIFLLSLICYIIAWIKITQFKMTVIVNWFDAILLGVAFFLIAKFLFAGIDDDYTTHGLIGAGCLYISLMWTVIANIGSPFYAFIGVGAKLFLFILIFIVIFLAFFLYISGSFHKKTHKKVRSSFDGREIDVELTQEEQEAEDIRYKREITGYKNTLSTLFISLINDHRKYR